MITETFFTQFNDARLLRLEEGKNSCEYNVLIAYPLCLQVYILSAGTHDVWEIKKSVKKKQIFLEINFSSLTLQPN